MYRSYLREHAVKDAGVVGDARLMMRRLLLAVGAPVIAVRRSRRGRRRQIVFGFGRLVRDLDSLNLFGYWARGKVFNVFFPVWRLHPPPWLFVLGARGASAALGGLLWSRLV